MDALAEDKSQGLIDQIYAAAVDPSKWPVVAESIKSAMGSQSVNIVQYDYHHQQFDYAYTSAMPESEVQRYTEKVIQHDDILDTCELYQAGTTVITQNSFKERHRKSHRAMKDATNSVQHTHFNIGCFFKKDTKVGWVNVVNNSSDPLFSQNEKKLLSKLLPHLKTAMYLSEQLLNAQHSTRLYADSLDRIDRACVFLTTEGKIAFKNHKFDSLVSDSCVQLNNNTIELFDEEANKQLYSMMNDIKNEKNHPQHVLSFSTGNKRNFLLHWLPYQPDDLKPNIDSEKITSVVFIQEMKALINSLETIDILWRLTPTEQSVLNSFIDGRSNNEVADNLQLSPNAVKFHIKNIFRKTNTRSQTELIGMASRVKNLSRKRPIKKAQ